MKLLVSAGSTRQQSFNRRLARVAARHHLPLLLPQPRYCGDNAAMIAALAASGAGVRGGAAFALDATPSLRLGG